MHRLFSLLLLFVGTFAVCAVGQTAPQGPAAGSDAKKNEGPTDPKAVKTYNEAQLLLKQHEYAFALEGFRKADKQDGGKCVACEIKAFQTADKIQNFRVALEQTDLLLAHMPDPASQAQVHYLAGQTCLSEGVQSKRERDFQQADTEFQAALKIQPAKAVCFYADGIALSHLKQDGDAKERFEQYLKTVKPNDVDYARAQRFAEHPELARARVAPNFELTTLDGKNVTLESLTGKVVLIDFWATWCGPCREALPHVKEIAQKFQGQPFVVVSISMDRDEAKWKEFVGEKGMTWMQYRDGYFNGPVATMFGVTAIPATFTIDADGILQDQHVGDAEIESKIKKLIARAQEVASKKTVAEVQQ